MKRWVIAMLLLCGLFGHTEAFAYGYNRNMQSASWGYQPVYGSYSSHGSSASIGSSPSLPTYHFQTTSPYISTLGEVKARSFMTSGSPGTLTSGWTDEENPVGEVDDEDPMPIGDIPWCLMLLLVAAYIAYKKCSRGTFFFVHI